MPPSTHTTSQSTMVFAFAPYVDLAAVYAREGKMDEAKLALAEARRLNPNLSVKLLQTGAPAFFVPAALSASFCAVYSVAHSLAGLAKAGAAERAIIAPTALAARF